jgi:membrane-bound ClpP family serine protease
MRHPDSNPVSGGTVQGVIASSGAWSLDGYVCDQKGSDTMIILGVILLILGFVFSIPVLWTIGLILVAVGVVLMILGATGRAVAGRRYWY